jgi:hypothetical protein
MNSGRGPAQSDVEIRASIDELEKAEENVRRVREEGEAGSKKIHPRKSLRRYRGWQRSMSLRAEMKHGTSYTGDAASDSSKPRRDCIRHKRSSCHCSHITSATNTRESDISASAIPIA